MKLNIQKDVLGVDNQVAKTGINTVGLKFLLGTGFVFIEHLVKAANDHKKMPRLQQHWL